MRIFSSRAICTCFFIISVSTPIFLGSKQRKKYLSKRLHWFRKRRLRVYFLMQSRFLLEKRRWSLHNADANDVLNNQDRNSENGSQRNSVPTLESNKGPKQPSLDLNFTESLPPGIPETEATIVEGIADLSAGIESLWQIEDVDAPNVPEHFTLVAEGTFPVNIEEFFYHFFSNDAIKFFQKFREDCGDTDFRCTAWRRHEQFGHIRDLSFTHPLKILFGPKSGSCKERQNFRAYRNRHLVVETSQQVSDVPFGDYFHVQGLWVAEQDSSGENRCNLRVYINVAFSRKLLWKGKIEQSTRDECSIVYSIWIRNAHELVKQKLALKDQDLGEPTDHVLDNPSPEPEVYTTGLQVAGASKRVMISLSEVRNVLSQVFGPIQEALRLSTAMVSLSRDSCVALGLHLKRQSNFLLAMLVALVAISFLMQLASVILLSRGPRITVISQGTYMNSFDGERAEVINWMDERVRSLGREMQIMENRLERMRHEFLFLKNHLHDLQTHRTE
ncbi:GRAM domain family protein isoform X2 [Wolffia australiana]